MNRLVMAAAVVVVLAGLGSTASALPMVQFELDCPGCPGGQAVTWTTTQDATLAPGFIDASGWFHILVDISGTSSGTFDFYAHETGFDGGVGGGINLCTTGICALTDGYNGDDFSPPFALIYTEGPQVFTGGFEARFWLPGEYEMTEVLGGFQGPGYGPVHLSITEVSEVPEPATSALVLAGLGALVLTGRRRGARRRLE